MAALAACGIVVSLQQTLVLPILPELPQLLHTAADNASWLVTATLVAGAVAIPTLSRLADLYGKKRMILVALAVMVVGSVLGGLSDTLLPVIAARVLQGVGVALVPIGIAIMRDELPADRVPFGVALMSATLAIGAGAGLPLAGVVVEHLPWHAIFWIMAGASVLLLGVVGRVVVESEVHSPGSFDVPGAVLLSVALTALLLALSKGSAWGWGSARTIGLVAAGVVLLAVWVPLELRTASPLVDLRVAVRPAVALVNAASVLAGFAMFANMVTSTQLLQLDRVTGYGLGVDVLHAGLWMAPSMLAFGVMAPVASALIRSVGAAFTLAAGSFTMAAAYVARVWLSHDLAQVVVGSVVVGIGTSLAFAAMPNLIMAAVPETETASANGLNTLLRSVGTSTASATTAALTTSIVVSVAGVAYPSLRAFTAVFWIAAVAATVAGLLVLPLLRTRST